MVIEYYDIDKDIEEYSTSGKSTRSQRAINGHIVNVLNGKFRDISDKSPFNEIHIDSKTLLIFLDIVGLDSFKAQRNKDGSVIKNFMGYKIFRHNPDERYISLFNGSDEVARIYLESIDTIRDGRLNRILGE